MVFWGFFFIGHEKRENLVGVVDGFGGEMEGNNKKKQWPNGDIDGRVID